MVMILSTALYNLNCIKQTQLTMQTLTTIVTKKNILQKCNITFRVTKSVL